MFGFEFADKKKHCIFPPYDTDVAVKPSEIESISPLVWQEHCVECAMPLCYKSCVHYKRRYDGRCRLFEHGIEKFYNPKAILEQNVVIEMNEWAKLETFFFTSGFSYEKLCNVSRKVSCLGSMAQFLKIGAIRRFFYYIKEYYTRKIGDINSNIPKLFLLELENDEEPYVLNLENKANEQVMFRISLDVKRGYNRFWLPTTDLHYLEGFRNTLSIYPCGNKPQRLNIISLEIISLKPEFEDKYFIKSEQKVKCVVWDLDNTIWKGILGEDGIEGLEIQNDVVDIIKNLDSRGIVNSISSKNDEQKAIEALKHFGIYDYFVCPMINWEMKSENIKIIAKTLDIGIDTFVFVDDSFFELNEVRHNCLGIRTCNITEINSYITNSCFDVPVTEESKRRRLSYKEIALRNKTAVEYKDDITSFLKSCNMKVRISRPTNDELMRCYELLQRTNQLNLSGERISLEQLKEIVCSDDFDCFRIRVDDRFGDYGLVGLAIFDISDKKDVVLKHFVFSCRAARKRIEQSFFEYMCEYYKGSGYENIILRCNITSKNLLMRQVLEDSKLFIKTEDKENYYQLMRSLAEKIPHQDLMEIIFS